MELKWGDAPVFDNTTITIPATDEIVRNIQKEEYESEQWFKLYGQRNHVENSNRDLKRVEAGDLGQAKRRLGRGVTFQTLAAGFFIAADNIRRIIRGLTRITKNTKSATPAQRARRRRDMNGERLPHDHAPTVNEGPETPLRT